MKKTVLITGSTDGIGKETALELAAKNYIIIIHGRNKKKIESTINWIIKKTSNSDVYGIIADFVSLSDVKRMAEEVTGKFKQLDIIINNAAVFSHVYKETVDGLETTFQINYLAHFYLTNLLLNNYSFKYPLRIVNVSSMAHASSINFSQLLNNENYDGYRAYSLSKLLNLLFSYKLADTLRDKGITVNSLHPGVINTKLLIEGWGSIGSEIKEGAKNELFVSISDEVEGITGKYFMNGKIVSSAKISYDIEVQNKLWDFSVRLLKERNLD